jgi:mono/diheme cytochrome c family protein
MLLLIGAAALLPLLIASGASALPEYATRTGESCSACHVSPSGGGPRTLRGLLWSARGRPDRVPQLANVLIAPGVRDGLELYDAACAACHGAQGEGLYAMGLVGTGISARSVRSFIERGIPRGGMPGFAGQLTPEQIDLLSAYVAELADGTSPPPPERFPLPAPRLRCNPALPADDCPATRPDGAGGN